MTQRPGRPVEEAPGYASSTGTRGVRKREERPMLERTMAKALC